MSRLSRRKEKYGNGNEHSEANVNESTAARTRPFSFEEIMLRRKNKNVTADDKEGAGDTVKLSGKDNSGNISGHSELDGSCRRSKDSDIITKHASEDTMKRSSRKKEETASLKEDNSSKDKGRGSRDLEAKLKDRSEKDRHTKTKDSNYEKQSHHRGRNEERFRDENESKKRHSENLAGKEKYRDSERVKSERENKRKNLSRDGEKNKQETDGNSAKKYDSRKFIDSEPAERKSRKKDASQSHYDEPRQKRRRSRSRETRERDRKSVSPSPRVHKRSYHERQHGNSSLNSSKDRRQHSDTDRNTMASNGGYASSQRRHSGHGSKLGGYSPRKRRTELAIKTPSPTARSPEKKSAGWDLPPTADGVRSASTVLPNFQPTHQTVPSSEHLSSVVPVTPNAVRSLSETSPKISMANIVPIDSIQLTQATRPSRRLYVENLPASASDKSVVECLNKFFLSSGANHVQGTQPCISCIMSKEKGQAVVEFLTPEYASVALSFDGRSFSGSVLKVRRPKDFVEAATGVPEKSAPTVDTLSDDVKDSPHKIFIGGISKVLSSDMLQEVVCAFGVLKAYRFQVNENLIEPCAFLEYVDHSITLNACAGLNGMKLGGQVLTVVQAIPDAPVKENMKKPPFYGIPEHAKTLLAKPTKVLKIKNVFNPEDLSSISGQDWEELLEDVRLECAGFGTVRSINGVRCQSISVADPQAVVVTHPTDVEMLQDQLEENYTGRMETGKENIDHNSSINSRQEVANDVKELTEDVGDVENNQTSDIISGEDILNNGKSKLSKLDHGVISEVPNCILKSDAYLEDSLAKLDGANDRPKNAAADFIQNESSSLMSEELKQEENNGELGAGGESNGELGAASIQLTDNVGRELDSSEKNGNDGKELDSTEKGDNKQQENNLDNIFEHGCIFVEYLRTEASCMAAHCLHGRLYGDRIVVVNYVPHDLYLQRFPK